MALFGRAQPDTHPQAGIGPCLRPRHFGRDRLCQPRRRHWRAPHRHRRHGRHGLPRVDEHVPPGLPLRLRLHPVKSSQAERNRPRELVPELELELPYIARGWGIRDLFYRDREGVRERERARARALGVCVWCGVCVFVSRSLYAHTVQELHCLHRVSADDLRRVSRCSVVGCYV